MGYSYKQTTRVIDHSNEHLMTEILKNTQVWQDLSNPEIVLDKERQLDGIDYISPQYGNIDAKLVLSCQLMTFSQELAFIGRDGRWKQGWFSKSNETDKYLYIYAEVKGYEDNYYLAKQHFSKETLGKIHAVLVEKKKLQDEVHKTFKSDFNVYVKSLVRKYKQDLHELNKIRIDENLNKVYHTDAKKKPYVSCSWGKNKWGKPILPERPINVIVSRDTLEDIADKVWEIEF